VAALNRTYSSEARTGLRNTAESAQDLRPNPPRHDRFNSFDAEFGLVARHHPTDSLTRALGNAFEEPQSRSPDADTGLQSARRRRRTLKVFLPVEPETGPDDELAGEQSDSTL